MSSGTTQNIELNDCGCCEGVSVETPSLINNRPGLSAIAYRIGTHAKFRETLQARLSGSSQPALSSLSTRDNDDFSIALLDAWATVGDVLTFYQERIANEAYLRTATERLSVLELARLINYELRPGVAASTYLAFTIDDTPGAAGQALSTGTSSQGTLEQLPPIAIGIGTKVQSIPGPGELAQTFETIEVIHARPEWNAIKPRPTQPQNNLAFFSKAVVFAGTATELKKGDLLLIVDASPVPQKIVSVSLDDAAKTTRIDFKATPANLPSYTRPPGLQIGEVNEIPPKTELNADVTSRIIGESWDEADLSSLATMQGWNTNSLVASIKKEVARLNRILPTQVHAYRQQAALFGYNAPKQPTYKASTSTPELPSNWKEWDLDSENTKVIYLDRAYDGIVVGSYVTIQKRNKVRNIQIVDVQTVARTAYGISSKTTMLTLADSWWNILPGKANEFITTGSTVGVVRSVAEIAAPQPMIVSNTTSTVVATINRTLKDFRDVIVYVQSEKLPLAELPIVDRLEPSAVAVDGITLDSAYLGLISGQRVILTGERHDLKGVYASESLTLKKVILEAGFTVVTFNDPLLHSYVRNTVSINANVSTATHGETVQETLGSGDATKLFQRFTLRQPPLTYTSSSDASGGQSSLEVRVNDILWHEVPDFFGHGSEERIYTTLLDDDGKTTVIFGDGKTGARPPTGQENVKAKYRKGIGLAGLVKANQLSQLMTRPLGVKGVINPNAPTGAADRENLDDARRNAPLTVLTLGRIVSLRDYEDFARSFTGINKAFATWTWFGQKRGVFVTVAGAAGAEVTEDSQLYLNLLAAMFKSGNPLVPVRVKSYQPRLFRITAALKINPDYLTASVLHDAEQKLRDTFSFDAREFGQPVHLSAVVATLQANAGVIAVNVTGLYRSDQSAGINKHLAAAAPRPGDSNVSPAEMLTLDPQPIELGTFQ